MNRVKNQNILFYFMFRVFKNIIKFEDKQLIFP